MRFFLLALFSLFVSASAQCNAPPGWYVAGFGECLPCPVNTYSTTVQSTSCTPCPPGETSGLGSTSCSGQLPTSVAFPTQVPLQCGGASKAVFSNGYCLPSGSNGLYSVGLVGTIYPSGQSWKVNSGSFFNTDTFAFVTPLSSCPLGYEDYCYDTIPAGTATNLGAISFPISTCTNAFLDISGGISATAVGAAVIAECNTTPYNNAGFYITGIDTNMVIFTLQAVSTANGQLCVQAGPATNGVFSMSLAVCNSNNTYQQFYFYGNAAPYPLQLSSTFIGSVTGMLYSYGLTGIVVPNNLRTFHAGATYNVLDVQDGLTTSTAKIQLGQVSCTTGSTYCSSSSSGISFSIQFSQAPSTCANGLTNLGVWGGSAAVKDGANVAAICDTGVATTEAWNLVAGDSSTTRLSNIYMIQPWNNANLCLEVAGQDYSSVVFTLAACNSINPRQYWGFVSSNI